MFILFVFRYEDIETNQQRNERIIIQAFTAIGELNKKCPNMITELLETIDGVYDLTAKTSVQTFNSLLICILSIVNDGQIEAFMKTDISFKILKLLDSENETLCKNAFSCYLFMADAIASQKIKTQFTKGDFVDTLVLRMVKKKGR